VRGLLAGRRAALLMPTAPGQPPPCGLANAAVDDWRRRLISLTCIAGLAGLPQVCAAGWVSREGLGRAWQACRKHLWREHCEGRVQGGPDRPAAGMWGLIRATQNAGGGQK
jgi:hypothetical protein